MSHESIRTWAAEKAHTVDLKGFSVLELGSCTYFEGRTVRPTFENLGASVYVGTDLERGPYVDVACDASTVENIFGSDSFDVVVSTEMLEHVIDWRAVIHQIKSVCKRGGWVFLTTRSKGFHYHPAPFDMWRYEVGDMARIFRDFRIVDLASDPEMTGLFILAQKPNDFAEADLADVKLYSMLLHTRIGWVPANHLHYWVRFGNLVNSSTKLSLFLRYLSSREGRQRIWRYLRLLMRGRLPRSGETARRLREDWLSNKRESSP